MVHAGVAMLGERRHGDASVGRVSNSCQHHSHHLRPATSNTSRPGLQIARVCSFCRGLFGFLLRVGPTGVDAAAGIL